MRSPMLVIASRGSEQPNSAQPTSRSQPRLGDEEALERTATRPGHPGKRIEVLATRRIGDHGARRRQRPGVIWKRNPEYRAPLSFVLERRDDAWKLVGGHTSAPR